jgi:hypothetical protein
MYLRIRSGLFACGALVASLLITSDASAHRGGHGGSSTSRECLTSAARGLLARIEQRFGRMQIVSTCRPGARVAGSGRPSKHASGNAIDFSAGGRKGEVINWLIANHSGGIMTYAGMSHIHVDIGPRYVSLGSGGGRYASRAGRGTRYAGRSGRGWRQASARSSRVRYAQASRGERVVWHGTTSRRSGVRLARYQ